MSGGCTGRSRTARATAPTRTQGGSRRWAVLLYWLVDADRKVVEVWTPETVTPSIERTAVRWHPSGAGEALVIDLENLFRPI